MKVIVTRTYELDDTEKACREIEEQLKANGELCKNSVGIIFCHYEFVLSGVLDALCERLPFPVTGASTTLVGLNIKDDADVNEQCRLVLTVFSADDAEFITAKTAEYNLDSDLEKLAFDAIGGYDKPSFMVFFLPNIVNTNADAFVRETAKAAKGAPVFGGTSVDDSPSYTENCFVFEGGKAYRNRGSYLLVYGDVHPMFGSAVVTDDKYLPNTGVITKAKGREIIEINDKPVTDFTDGLGITIGVSGESNVFSAVLMLTDKDGNEYSRSMMHLSENNGLIVGGEVGVGDIVRVALFEKTNILAASAKITEETIKSHPNPSFAFVASCETRRILLGADTTDGEDMLRTHCGDLPFMLGYAGGEICPLNNSDHPVSRILNQSFAICVI